MGGAWTQKIKKEIDNEGITVEMSVLYIPFVFLTFSGVLDGNQGPLQARRARCCSPELYSWASFPFETEFHCVALAGPELPM